MKNVYRKRAHGKAIICNASIGCRPIGYGGSAGIVIHKEKGFVILILKVLL